MTTKRSKLQQKREKKQAHVPVPCPSAPCLRASTPSLVPPNGARNSVARPLGFKENSPKGKPFCELVDPDEETLVSFSPSETSTEAVEERGVDARDEAQLTRHWNKDDHCGWPLTHAKTRLLKFKVERQSYSINPYTELQTQAVNPSSNHGIIIFANRNPKRHPNQL